MTLFLGDFEAALRRTLLKSREMQLCPFRWRTHQSASWRAQIWMNLQTAAAWAAGKAQRWRCSGQLESRIVFAFPWKPPLTGALGRASQSWEDLQWHFGG